jgi:hypothetical protein
MPRLRTFLSPLKPTRLGVLFAVLIGLGVGFCALALLVAGSHLAEDVRPTARATGKVQGGLVRVRLASGAPGGTISSIVVDSQSGVTVSNRDDDAMIEAIAILQGGDLRVGQTVAAVAVAVVPGCWRICDGPKGGLGAGGLHSPEQDDEDEEGDSTAWQSHGSLLPFCAQLSSRNHFPRLRDVVIADTCATLVEGSLCRC